MVDSAAAGNLPREIITEILVRLPVKSIGRSRCVSKPWRSLLTSNEFIKNHLTRHTHLVQGKKVLLSTSRSLFTLTLHPDSCLSRKLDFFDKGMYSLVGSCNGLVFGATNGDGMCLINCLTREYADLSNSPFPARFRSHGFGYDNLSDDYRIVSISYCDKKPDCADPFVVDVYAVKTRSWKRLRNFPYKDIFPDLSSAGVFVNGVLHWMGTKLSDKSSVIVAFDLISEKFEEISSLLFLDRAKYARNQLVVIEGCLGIVSQLIGELVEVWFMETYSLAESWTKKITIDLLHMSWRPVYFQKDKLLIFRHDGKFNWYYPDDKRWDEWMINDNLVFELLETYSETLVSPHFNTHS